MSTSKTLNAAALSLLLTATPASAAIFDINGIDFGSFAVIAGEQNFDQLAPGSPFISSDLGTIVDIEGRLDLHAGTLNATLTLELSDDVAAINEGLNASTADRTFTISVNGFDFDADGNLLSTASGTITNETSVINSVTVDNRTSLTPGDGFVFGVDFLPTDTVAFNSLTVDGVVGADAQLNLWGFAQSFANQRFALGTDFILLLTERPDLKAVPVPAAAFLFGSSLLALFGIRQRKINATA